MSDPWVADAYDQFMEENPDWWERPEVIADLKEANRRHEELYGDSTIPDVPCVDVLHFTGYLTGD